VPADSCIHCTERIIEEVDICVLIHGSRKRRETSGKDTSHSLSLSPESQQCETTPCSFQESMERDKSLLHTGPPGEWGLCAHIPYKPWRRRGRMATETPFTLQG